MSPNPAIQIEPVRGRPLPRNESKDVPKQGEELGGKRIHELMEQVEALPDPGARVLLHECLQSVLALHGQGIARILKLVQEAGADGQSAFDRIVRDKVVRGLLLIHGLHPVDLEIRLGEALKKVRPYMESHGGNVELISLSGEVARLRFQGACKTCPSSAITMELAIRQAVEEFCPDLQGLELEGVTEQAKETKPVDDSSSAADSHTPAWTDLSGVGDLRSGEIKIVEAEGIPLAVCKVNENFYAYRNVCPACGLAFEAGALEGGLLKCTLGHCYEVQKAGRCPDKPKFHLDPFPLLEEGGVVKVAVK